MRPGTSVFTPYALLPIGMAACNALYQVLTRKVAGSEHPLTSLVWLGTGILTIGGLWSAFSRRFRRRATAPTEPVESSKDDDATLPTS